MLNFSLSYFYFKYYIIFVVISMAYVWFPCLLCQLSMLGTQLEMIQASLSSKDQSSLQLNASAEGSPSPAIKLMNDLKNSKSLSSRSLTNLISASNIILNRSRKNSLRSDPEVEVVIHRDDSQSNMSINKSANGSHSGLDGLQTPKMNQKALNKPQYGTYLHVPGTIPVLVTDEFRSRCNSDSRMAGLTINKGISGSNRSSQWDERDNCPMNDSVYFAHAWSPSLLKT